MFQTRRSGVVDTVSGSQPLTIDNISSFQNAVQSCFGNGQPKIVLDLGAIPMMDSAGIETLLELRDKCQRLGGSCVLARPNALCRDILRINGIDRELNIYNDSTTAMGSFAR